MSALQFPLVLKSFLKLTVTFWLLSSRLRRKKQCKSETSNKEPLMFGISGRKLSSAMLIMAALFAFLFSQLAMAQTNTPTPIPAATQVELTGDIDAVNGSRITVAQQVID